MSHIMKKKYYSYEQICVIALCNMAEYIKIQKHYFVSKTTVSSNELTKSLKVRKVYLLSFCFFCFMTHAYSFLSRFCPSWTFQSPSSEIETRKKGFFFVDRAQDIALLKLLEPAVMGPTVSPACLPDLGDFGDDSSFPAGQWGQPKLVVGYQSVVKRPIRVHWTPKDADR